MTRKSSGADKPRHTRRVYAVLVGSLYLLGSRLAMHIAGPITQQHARPGQQALTHVTLMRYLSHCLPLFWILRACVYMDFALPAFGCLRGCCMATV